MLIAAWLLDVLTPQLLVIAILLNGPIALSSLALDSRFTQLLVATAVVADVTAGYANGVHDGYRWDSIALADRVIAGFSFLLVGGLSIATQRSAARAGELAARQARATRERSVRHAIETIRGSVNPELIKRSIVREALGSLTVDAARLYAFDPNIDEPTTYAIATASEVITAAAQRQPSPVSSFLHRISRGERVAQDDDRIVPPFGRGDDGIVTIDANDAFGRLLLDTLGMPYAIAVPLVEHATTFGVLILLRQEKTFEAHFGEALSAYADQSAIALAQAALFVQLAERNDELAAASTAMRERSDVIRDIVYALSHDLRTPLGAARMTMIQARDGAYGPLPHAYGEILDRSIASNDELQRLAETLLLVSRYEADERSVRRDDVALGVAARGAIDELEPLWRSKAIDLTFNRAAEPTVAGDEREIHRALVNLLANAITWTPAQRRIIVTVGEAAGVARVTISDDGYGVPERERAGLFERVRSAPSRQGAGSGLGLYLVRRIAQSHDGDVTYAPETGGGSIFTFALPLAAAASLR